MRCREFWLCCWKDRQNAAGAATGCIAECTEDATGCLQKVSYLRSKSECAEPIMSLRKRLDALSEILESERSYVCDMMMWAERFRMQIMRSPRIKSSKKHVLCERIFINIDDILGLHRQILQSLEDKTYRCAVEELGLAPDSHRRDERIGIAELMENKKYEGLEYHTVFSRYVERFTIYEEYANKLPQAESVMRAELGIDESFKALLYKFLRDNNAESLGHTHFIYRPTQKMTRYYLLFRTVLKNETNPQYIDAEQKLCDRLADITKDIDSACGRAINAFRIYEISKMLRRSELYRPRASLNLFAKNRKIIKEGDVVVRTKFSIVPKIQRVLVFDHLIMICDVAMKQASETCLYLQDTFAAYKFNVVDRHISDMDSFVQTFFPVYLVETNGDRFLGLFFRSRQEREIWKRIMEEAVQRYMRRYDPNIKVLETEYVTSETILKACCAYVTFDESRLADDEFSSPIQTDDENELGKTVVLKGVGPRAEDASNQSPVSESLSVKASDGIGLGMENNVEEPVGFLQRILFGGDFFGKQIWIRRLPRNERKVVVFATERGIYKRCSGKNYMIHGKSTRNLIFIGSISLLVFLEGSKVVVASFNAETTRIWPQSLHEDAESVFYSQNRSSKFILVKKGRHEAFSMIYMYIVEERGSQLSISMFRRLSIGSDVQSVRFVGKDLAVASKMFDLVNPNSLMTNEIVNPLDSYLPHYFLMCRDTRAMAILQVSKKCHLVCFDALGFVIDKNGNSSKSHVVFSWNCKPHDFRVFGGYLVVLGVRSTSVFSLKSSNLLFFRNDKTFQFCTAGKNRLVLHDSHRFYDLVLPVSGVYCGDQ